MVTAPRHLLPLAPASQAEAPVARLPARFPRSPTEAPDHATAIGSVLPARVTVSSLTAVEASVATARTALQAAPATSRAKMKPHNDLRSGKSDHEHKRVLVLVAAE